MVSLTSIIASVGIAAVACTTTVSASASSNSVIDLPVGEYYRPEGDIVSGAFWATTPFRRTPCPLLNTLANHGFLPRNGTNLTKNMLREVIQEKLNLDLAFVETLLSSIPSDTFDFNLIGIHGIVEHDASLVHADSAFGSDPASIDPALVADVVSRGDGQHFGIQEIGELRRDRLATCVASNPKCLFGSRERSIAFGEAGLLLDVLGGNKNSTISRAHLESFLVHERFPEDYVKSPSLVSLAQIQTTAVKLITIASRP